MSIIPPATQGALIAGAAALLVGLSNVFTPAVYDAGSNPLTLLLLRYTAFALVCLAWLRLRREPLWLGRNKTLESYGIGVCFLAGGGGLITSFAYLPVSLAILVFYAFPLLILLFESLLDRHLPTRAQTLLMSLAFAGVALSLGVSSVELAPIGFTFALLGAVGVALAFTWTNRRMRGVDRIVLTTHMSLASALLSGLAIVLTDGFALVEPTPRAWTDFTMAAGLFCAGFVAMFAAIGRIGATRTSMVMNLEVVFTVACAVVLLGETFSVLQGVGALLVVGAVTAMQLIEHGT